MAAFTPTGVEFVAKNVNIYMNNLSKADKAQQKMGESLTDASGRARDAQGRFVGAGQGASRLAFALPNVSQGLAAVSSAMLGVSTIAAGAAVAAVTALTASIVVLGTISVRTAISFESAFAGVIKTVDGLITSTGELTRAGEKLRQGFVDLSKTVPLAFEELAAIGELGGQLGIGQDALLEFSETIADLGVTTNLSTEEAATGLARFANIFNVTSADMGKNVERVGSTLVALGNNFATTERDILSFGERLAGVGNIAGLTQADVLAIGTALSSVGVEAEAGSTAVQKALLAMNDAAVGTGKNLVKFARISGFSAEEFKEAWEKDAGGAFRLFVEGLAREGDNAVSVLEELGLTDQRLIRAFLSLSGAGGLLAETINLASGEFEDGNALADEAANRYATVESQIQILKNTFQAIRDEIGTGFLPVFLEIIEAGKNILETVGPPLVASFGLLADVLSLVIDKGKKFISSFFGDMKAGAASLTDFIQALRDTLAGLTGEDILGQLGASVQSVQSDMMKTLDELRDASAKTIEAINNEIASSGDVLASTLDRITEDFANQATEINEKFAERMGKINEQIARASEDLGRKLADIAQKAADKRLDIEDSFAETRRRINEQIANSIIKFEEQIADKKIALAEKVADITERFAEKQLEIQAKIQDAVVAFQAKQAAIQEKFAKEKEKITQKSEENINDLRAQLAAATTDEEKMQIQARIAEEEQARDKALAEVAAREKKELDALQAKHDEAVAILEDRLAREETARDEAIAKAEAQAGREIEKLTTNHNRAVKALQDRLKREEGQRDKALAKVDRDRERDEKKAKEANARKTGDLKKRLAEETTERDKQLADLKAKEQAEIESAKQKHETLLTELQARLLEEEAALANRQEQIRAAAAEEIASLRETAEARAGALEQFAGPLQAIEDVFQKVGEIVQKIKDFVLENIEPIKGAFAGLGVVLAGAGILAFLSILGTILGAISLPLALITAGIIGLGVAWETNFLGIRDIISQVWEEILKPIFELWVQWMEFIIPKALEVLTSIWENILQPALLAFSAFLQEVFIPGLAILIEWLEFIIPPAIQFLTDAWNNILLPILRIVWAFLSEILIPILSELANIWLAIVKKEVELLAGIWQNVLLPQLKIVWAFIQDNIIPIFQKVIEIVRDVFGPVIEAVAEKFDPFIEALKKVKDFIKDIIDRLGELAESIANIDLGFFSPGSPSPFEISIKGIDDALTKLGATVAISPVFDPQTFEMPMDSSQPLATPFLPPATGGSAEGGAKEINLNMGPITINNDMDVEVLEARIKRTISEVI